MPKNLQAILDWFAKNRKDIPQATIMQLVKQDAFILMCTASFEAGRQFQKDHPEIEGPGGYLS